MLLKEKLVIKVITAQYSFFIPFYKSNVLSFPQSYLTKATNNLQLLGFALQQSLILKSLTFHSPTAGQSIAHIQILNQLSKQFLMFKNSVPLLWLTIWLMKHL